MCKERVHKERDTERGTQWEDREETYRRRSEIHVERGEMYREVHRERERETGTERMMIHICIDHSFFKGAGGGTLGRMRLKGITNCILKLIFLLCVNIYIYVCVCVCV
jgi:hypothetical protein